MTKIQQIVAKSAKILDEKISGWAKKIKLKILTIDSNENCILGQLGDDPYSVLNTLGIKAEETIKYGFETESKNKELDDTWKQEIRQRKGLKKP